MMIIIAALCLTLGMGRTAMATMPVSCDEEDKFNLTFEELFLTEIEYNESMTHLLMKMQRYKNLFENDKYPSLKLMFSMVGKIKNSSDRYLLQLSSLEAARKSTQPMREEELGKLLPRWDYFADISDFTNFFDELNQAAVDMPDANREFRKFATDLEDSFYRKSDIGSFLIRPVQRVPRIKLLLEQLKKYVLSNEVVDGNLLIINKVLSKINENKREFDADLARKNQAKRTEAAIKKWGRPFLQLSPADREEVMSDRKTMKEALIPYKKFGAHYASLSAEDKMAVLGLGEEEYAKFLEITSLSTARRYLAEKLYEEEFVRLREVDKVRFLALSTTMDKRMFLIRRHYGPRYLSLPEDEKEFFLNHLKKYTDRKAYLYFFFPKPKKEITRSRPPKLPRPQDVPKSYQYSRLPTLTKRPLLPPRSHYRPSPY